LKVGPGKAIAGDGDQRPLLPWIARHQRLRASSGTKEVPFVDPVELDRLKSIHRCGYASTTTSSTAQHPTSAKLESTGDLLCSAIDRSGEHRSGVVDPTMDWVLLRVAVEDLRDAGGEVEQLAAVGPVVMSA